MLHDRWMMDEVFKTPLDRIICLLPLVNVDSTRITLMLLYAIIKIIAVKSNTDQSEVGDTLKNLRLKFFHGTID